MTNKFSQSVIENLGYYVYFLRDPRDSEVFYVGKGKGNRIFQHLACALKTHTENEKLDQIREIEKAGRKVEHFVLRHGLTEEEAFEVEAALIDYLGVDSLANIMGGKYSSDYGIKTTGEIIAQYSAKKLVALDSLVLININKLFRRDMTAGELYESTRKAWVIGKRREKALYAVPHWRGLTREVYKIDQWHHCPGNGKNRWAFSGELADDEVRGQYCYRSVKSLFKQGASNPIRYVNC